jgi:hypothetical protein
MNNNSMGNKSLAELSTVIGESEAAAVEKQN